MAKGLIRKTWITVAGIIVVLAGIAMLALPGPGLVTIAAGIAILATEFEWAQRLMAHLRRRLELAEAKLRSRSRRNDRPKDL